MPAQATVIIRLDEVVYGVGIPFTYPAGIEMSLSFTNLFKHKMIEYTVILFCSKAGEEE